MVRSTSFGRSASAAILGVALVAGVPASADDGALKGAIEARFQSAKLDRQSVVEVQVESGRATLTGAALTIHARRELERQARKVVGVVDNQVRVLPEERTDRDIRQDVSNAILSYPHYTIFDSVELGVADGVVVLRGSVLQPYRKNEIEQRIGKIAGVRAIHNEIAVQGVSINDARLRREIARAIYDDPRFVQYRHRANPPIHIVVDHGKVRLTGYVASPVERAIIGHIVNSFPTFGVENLVRVDGEAPEEPVKDAS